MRLQAAHKTSCTFACDHLLSKDENVFVLLHFLVHGAIQRIPNCELHASQERRSARLRDPSMQISQLQSNEYCAAAWQGHELVSSHGRSAHILTCKSASPEAAKHCSIGLRFNHSEYKTWYRSDREVTHREFGAPLLSGRTSCQGQPTSFEDLSVRTATTNHWDMPVSISCDPPNNAYIRTAKTALCTTLLWRQHVVV